MKRGSLTWDIFCVLFRSNLGPLSFRRSISMYLTLYRAVLAGLFASLLSRLDVVVKTTAAAASLLVIWFYYLSKQNLV